MQLQKVLNQKKSLKTLKSIQCCAFVDDFKACKRVPIRFLNAATELGE